MTDCNKLQLSHTGVFRIQTEFQCVNFYTKENKRTDQHNPVVLYIVYTPYKWRCKLLLPKRFANQYNRIALTSSVPLISSQALVSQQTFPSPLTIFRSKKENNNNLKTLIKSLIFILHISTFWIVCFEYYLFYHRHFIFLISITIYNDHLLHKFKL